MERHNIGIILDCFDGCFITNYVRKSIFHGDDSVMTYQYDFEYRNVSNIRRTKSQHLKDSRTAYRLVAVFAEFLEARCWVENEVVVEAAPTGDTPTTSEWSTILLPTRARLILETLR